MLVLLSAHKKLLVGNGQCVVHGIIIYLETSLLLSNTYHDYTCCYALNVRKERNIQSNAVVVCFV